MESTLTAVVPARPVAGYVGGKRNLAKRIVAMIDQVPHATYAEPFVGMGGIFLRRRLRPKGEVINDWSADVYNLYRVLQVHYVAFLDHMKFQITSRAEFERLTQVEPTTLTDIQRAARFLYLQRTAFGGKVRGRGFGVETGRPGAFDISRIGPMLEELHERLAGVIVERLPWSKFLARYDRPDTLFYLDPPYYGCEDFYGVGMFDRSEFIEMASALQSLRGRFILSLNDLPETREIFSGFQIEPVGLSYQVSGQVTEGKELIISRT